MFHLLKAGGFTSGGINFDAKVRRQSVDAVDLFHAHVGGVDVMARALLNAAALIEDGGLDRFISDRYAGWREGLGADLLMGRLSLAQAAEHAVAAGAEPRLRSGRQEMLENLVNGVC